LCVWMGCNSCYSRKLSS